MPDTISNITFLSGSTQGRNIKIAATTSPGTTLHTTNASASIEEQIDLDACNVTTGKVTLTIQWGGTTDPDDNFVVDVPAQVGPVRIVSGLRLRGNGSTGLVVRAFASVANAITMNGSVKSIS